MYCAFCQGDQTFRRLKMAWFLKFLYAFKNESRLVAPPSKFIVSIS